MMDKFIENAPILIIYKIMFLFYPFMNGVLSLCLIFNFIPKVINWHKDEDLILINIKNTLTDARPLNDRRL